MGDYIYLVQLDIPEEHEDDFNRIYDEEHIPLILEVPGVEKCTRYKMESCEVGDVPRYAATRLIRQTFLPAKSSRRPQTRATGLPRSGPIR